MGGVPGASGSDVYGPNGQLQNMNMTYNGAPINFQNPTQFTNAQMNPEAAAYNTNTNNLYSEFQSSSAGNAFNPNAFAGMQAQQQSNLTSSMGNQMAAMGLSGSSAEVGGMSNAIQNNQMAWLQKQQGMQMQAMQGLEGLNNTGYQQTMGIQNQYGGFQDVANQDILGLLGAQQQAQAAQNSMWGQIAGGVLGAGGQIASGGMMSSALGGMS
jgi:hypothetical protein